MKAQSKICVVVLTVCLLLIAVPLFGDEGDPPNCVARLSYMENAVSFEPAGENDWSQATLNYPMTTGDRLWTDNDARAELETGNVAIRMSQQTDLTTTNLTDQLIQLGLAQGSIRIAVYDLRPNHSIEVDTPSAALTIVQAGNYRFDTYPDQNMTLVTVTSGSLQATGDGLNQTVEAGQSLQLTGTNPVQMSWVAVPADDSFDQWSAQRDQKYQRAQARQYVSPEVPGYYDLDGYGSWSSDAQYGPVWYPSGVAAGWCPYREGRWVWVEPWGWTWVEIEPWGFAPFHYGRWVQIGPRWGWLPGPVTVAPIYGPAFVAFVGGPGFSVAFGTGGVAAWFPLGPGEPYYPWYHHSDVYLRQVNVTNVRNINVTNITNVTNVHYRYQTVGTTAVNSNTFRNSEPVMRNMVRVDPQELQRAQVIPHPQINPAQRAVLAGSNPTHPPVPAQRPTVVQHPPVANLHPTAPNTARNVPPANEHPAEAARPSPTAPARPAETETARPNEAPRTVPNETRTPPENARTEPPAPERTAPETHTTTPTPVARPAQPPAQSYRGAPPANRAPLVSNTAPPSPKLPYQQKAPAMEEHPGRPLEPQQRANIAAGKPAGPMNDREYPPHAAPVTPQHSAPQQSHSAPSHSSNDSKH